MHMLEQHQGKDHVSAQDQADENMADSGDGVYLAKYKGEYMEVSMESANQLTVSAGALWVNGRFCIVDPAETLTVDNGSSGMTEYDLVCVHWKETTATQQVALAEGGTKEVSTTVEETELVIVKGDPASSGATDPEISQTTIRAGVGEAWVPFARITKDGLTPSVAFIVDRLVPESDFRDSISPATVDSWETIKIGSTLVATIRTEITTAINTKEGIIYISNIVSIPLPSGFNISNTVAVASIVGTTWRWCNAFIREDNPDSLSVRLFSGTSQSSASYAVGVVLIGQV